MPDSSDLQSKHRHIAGHCTMCLASSFNGHHANHIYKDDDDDDIVGNDNRNAFGNGNACR
ncbi:unnamed protein product [Dovyalis caffra]|uniref:Uncharacterized protein n=1 Tax=Dovyalis caffra TaxID=77055 RepID=A0AAV1SFK6_9ROSI|nr:unnamed protein product [Dovyalis caffra]